MDAQLTKLEYKKELVLDAGFVYIVELTYSNKDVTRSNNIRIFSNLEMSNNIEVNSEICNLTIEENETVQNLLEIFEFDENNEIVTYFTDEDNNYKIHYEYSKQKNTSSEIEIDSSEDNVSKVYKNKNKDAKISNFTLEETKISKQILEFELLIIVIYITG
ncbi:14442_t:CDS:2, partial [Cetraspora pellucida]